MKICVFTSGLEICFVRLLYFNALYNNRILNSIDSIRQNLEMNIHEICISGIHCEVSLRIQIQIEIMNLEERLWN